MTYPLNTIQCMDVEAFLDGLPDASVPLFLFSPPYNLGNSTGGGIRQYRTDATKRERRKTSRWHATTLQNGYSAADDAMPHAEYVAWQQRILSACWRALAPNGAIYYQHKPRILDGVLVEPRDYVPPELPIRQRIVWARAGGFNFNVAFYCPTHEEILVIAKSDFRLAKQSASGVGTVWSIPQVANTWHPAPFPLALALRVLETTRPRFVVDPFMGSGTTAKAAKTLGIDWLGNDNAPAYIERALREIEQIQPMNAAFLDVAQEVLFEEAA